MTAETTKAAIEEALEALESPEGWAYYKHKAILEALVSKVTAEAERERDDYKGLGLKFAEQARMLEASARGLAEVLRKAVAWHSAMAQATACLPGCAFPQDLARAALSEWEAAEAGKGRRG